MCRKTRITQCTDVLFIRFRYCVAIKADWRMLFKGYHCRNAADTASKTTRSVLGGRLDLTVHENSRSGVPEISCPHMRPPKISGHGGKGWSVRFLFFVRRIVCPANTRFSSVRHSVALAWHSPRLLRSPPCRFRGTKGHGLRQRCKPSREMLDQLFGEKNKFFTLIL